MTVGGPIPMYILEGLIRPNGLKIKREHKIGRKIWWGLFES